MKKSKLVLAGIIGVSTVLVSSLPTVMAINQPMASKAASMSAETIIKQAIEKNKSLSNIMIEATRTKVKNNKVYEIEKWKCWEQLSGNERKVEKRRIERKNNKYGNSIQVQDRKTVQSYREGAKTVTIEEFHQEAHGSSLPFIMGPNELLTDSYHTLSLVGEDKIGGWNTYHIVAKPKGTNPNIAKEEYWIDKSTGITVKYIEAGKGSSFEYVVTKLTANSKFPKDIFTLKLPKGVKTQQVGKV
jgi:outer membrane lipoprotein-sorting protein